MSDEARSGTSVHRRVLCSRFNYYGLTHAVKPLANVVRTFCNIYVPWELAYDKYAPIDCIQCLAVMGEYR
jgi:hypothetical protein